MENLSKELDNLCKDNPLLVANEFAKFLMEYTEPSFGSISKRDIDIKIFNIMRNLGVISKNPKPWEIISKLKVQSTRAKSLVYNANLQREGAFSDIEGLRKAIKKAPYINESNYVKIQIDNPLHIDQIKAILSEADYMSDGSFSPDIIKVKPKVYMYLYFYSLDEKQKDDLDKRLQKAGKITQLKGVANGLFETAKNILDNSPIDAITAAFFTVKNLIGRENDDAVIENFFKILEERKKEME